VGRERRPRFRYGKDLPEGGYAARKKNVSVREEMKDERSRNNKEPWRAVLKSGVLEGGG